TLAAAWLGLASYFMWAALLCWMVYAISVILHLGWAQPMIANVLFGAAALTSLYGLINANLLRVTRISVSLRGLPEQWRGRTALLMSDLHLGHIRNKRFVRRVIKKTQALQPNIVLIAGDLYDGTAGDFDKLAEPWAEFLSSTQTTAAEGELLAQPVGGTSHSVTAGTRAGQLKEIMVPHSPGRRSAEVRALDDSSSAQAGVPFDTLRAGTVPHNSFFGVYYMAGNHEEFYSHAEYLPALTLAGVRVLNNEKIELEGLQLLGVHYRDAIEPEAYRAILHRAAIDRSRASILLLHAPVKLSIAEQEGISLQLAGHTHGGQFFPYTWIAGRVWGRFIHGLQRLGSLQVYTSYGAGTWGPPFRVGTQPEIVLISFE
ncbi:MAG TPA: hypothetical protein VFL42_09905, partial [Terriglobales bacterium]|nr:hypothetical protein [Terriglobales bacterium]